MEEERQERLRDAGVCGFMLQDADAGQIEGTRSHHAFIRPLISPFILHLAQRLPRFPSEQPMPPAPPSASAAAAR